MPTIFSHIAVPLALGLAVGAPTVSKRLLLAGMAASILPDLDVLAFRLGIAYSHEFGHRGFSHALAFALLVGFLAAGMAQWLQTTRKVAFAFIFVAAASHGLLDMLTNGGLGVALLWPFTEQRYFFPWRGIDVSPLGMHFFGPRAWAVLQSELLWVWLPSLGAGLALYVVRLKIRATYQRGQPERP
jgi:inner membrane protein